MRAVGVFDDELAALVVVRIDEEERRREIGADAVRRAGHLPDRVVDVAAERVTAGVLIEERRKHLERQRRRHEERAALQRAEDHFAELARLRRILRQLQVLLGARRLRSSRDFAIDPCRGVEDLTGLRHLVGSQDVRNV